MNRKQTLAKDTSSIDHFARTETAVPLLIPVSDLAKMLNVSRRSIWRLLSARKMPPPIRIGGAVRWRFDEVKRWIEAGCPVPNSPDS